MGIRPEKTREHRRFLTLLFLVLCLSFAVIACGYRVERLSGGVISGDASIEVERFRNATSLPAGSVTLGEKLRENFVREGYRLLENGRGDYIVRGKISRFDESPVGFSPDRFGLEYSLTVEATLRVVSRHTGEVFFEDHVVGKSTYYAGTDSSYTRTNRERAMDAALSSIAERFIRHLSARIRYGGEE
ncbi:MAG: hypothetical protein D6713_00475 [Deltaproteobacteria bacterium]|nr:MAG: hypothetical protein D6713_00475 [Deltaproteobacteria bacterium]